MFPSLEGTKKVIQENIKTDIEADVYTYVREQLSEIIIFLCRQAQKTHDEFNNHRKQIGLREKKRLGKECFYKPLAALKTNESFVNIGKEGATNSHTSLSRSYVMKKQERKGSKDSADIKVVR
jgi:hypothetical protein